MEKDNVMKDNSWYQLKISKIAKTETPENGLL